MNLPSASPDRAGLFRIFRDFLVLGCTSFGGPAAHLGYFRQAFVERRQWLDDAAYARLVALAQFLPGPSSSQVGFALGCHRAGWKGGVAASLGFTLPSFLVMLALAALSHRLPDHPAAVGLLEGLKALAVVVVADAVWKMFGMFCGDRVTRVLCLGTAALLLTVVPAAWQWLPLVLAGLLGGCCLDAPGGAAAPVPGRIRRGPLATFLALLAAAPLLTTLGPLPAAQFGAFYQAGSLVFGGGHVVLPLLQGLVGDTLPPDRFLTGYAAAQAVPGPMFTLSTFLGYEGLPASPLLGAAVATLAIFLPGFLLVLSFREAWTALAARPQVAGAVRGLNAAVVGLLLAALIDPVMTRTIHSPIDAIAPILAFVLLRRRPFPAAWLVPVFAALGALRAVIA